MIRRGWDVWGSVVRTVAQDTKEANTEAGHQEITVRVDPPVFAVSVTFKGGGNHWPLSDELLAKRVVKALAHAAELCRGGSNK